MPAADAQLNMAVKPAEADDVKGTQILGEVFRVYVVLFVHAEGEIVQVRQSVDGVLIVAVGDNVARAGHQTGKLAEGALHGGKILEVVQVVGFNVVDDGDGGIKIQKGVTVFTALHDDGVTVTHPVSGLEQRKITAQHHRRVLPCLHENLGDHGSGGGFAVGAGNADGVFIFAHDEAPGLCAFKDRDAQGAGSGDLGIVIVSCCGADNAVGALDVFGAVADMDFDALGDELIGGDRGVHVRTGDHHAHAPQHKTQGPHGNAADADEMNVFAGNQIGVQSFADCHKKDLQKKAGFIFD